MPALSSNPTVALPRRDIFWLVFLVPLLFGYLNLFHNTLIDDAFIHLRYARTLRESGTWGMFPGHVANTATSALNVILLALTGSFTSSMVGAALFLTFIEFVLLALFLRGIARALELPLFGYLAFIALICNPLLLSTIGLESILLTTSLVAALYAYLTNRWNCLAIACAVTTLARPDGILFFIIVLFVIPTSLLRARTVALYVFCLIPWYLFSWIYLGSVLPDSFLLKVGQGWADLTFANAIPFYFRRYPFEMILSICLLPFALLAGVKPLRHLGAVVYVLAAFGLLHFGAYAFLHVPPYHWYYTPEVVTIILLGALTVAALHKTMTTPWKKRVGRILAVITVAIPIVGVSYLLGRGSLMLQEALIHTNWATPNQYRDVGLWLKERHAGETILMRGEVGTLAYYCDCNLLDPFGDRTWLTHAVREKTNRAGFKSFIFRTNFLFYREQTSYVPGVYRIEASISRKPAHIGHIHSDGTKDTSVMVWKTSSRWVPSGQITLLKAQ